MDAKEQVRAWRKRFYFEAWMHWADKGDGAIKWEKSPQCPKSFEVSDEMYDLLLARASEDIPLNNLVIVADEPKGETPILTLMFRPWSTGGCDIPIYKECKDAASRPS